MKRFSPLVLITCLVLLSSCESGLFKEPVGSKFNPPNWIIGTWGDFLDWNVYTFSSDNVIYASSEFGFSIDFKSAYGSHKITESVSSTSYEFSVYDSGTIMGTYRFDLANSVSLNYYITTSGMTVGPVLLLRQ